MHMVQSSVRAVLTQMNVWVLASEVHMEQHDSQIDAWFDKLSNGFTFFFSFPVDWLGAVDPTYRTVKSLFQGSHISSRVP